ncbi:DUF3592 domain-containing protein [Streptomyces himastatinicus]|uniref:DUF3592 domain-containing protein n=1 Tax=Streptomyces himastatinicus TaxID=998084 RepID=UPI000586E1B8|nr:DUF3592 domain-containing protein [Streptomyces himastatinicus]
MRFQVRGRGGRRWVPFVVIAFGALFLAIGLILAGVSASFLTDAKRARGTVVSLEWRNDHETSPRTQTDDKPAAYPVVAFTSADGAPRKFEDSTGSNPPSYELGERVEVLYAPGSPEDARINGFASLWLMPLIFGGIGFVIAGIGTGVAVATRRRS